MSHFPLRRPLAALVCLILTGVCPGPGSYAAAQSIARSASAPASPPSAIPAALFSGEHRALPGLTSADTRLVPIVVAPSAPTPDLPLAASALAAALQPAIAPTATLARSALPASGVSAVSRDVVAALEKVGPLGHASAPSASELGQALENALAGASALSRHDDLTAPAFDDGAPAAWPKGLAGSVAAAKIPVKRAPKTPLVPKLIATTAALVPAYFFGAPILAGHSLVQIGLYGALLLPLVATPFLGNAPGWVRNFLGRGLFYNGLFLFLNGNAIVIGLLSLLGGWGFRRWVGKTKAGVAAPESGEVGSYIGALGLYTAVGAAWAGYLTGWVGWGAVLLAAASSPFLLGYLPHWFWLALGAPLSAFAASTRDFAAVAGFWHRETSFLSNLMRFSSYWMAATSWNALWLSPLWAATFATMAAEFASAVALSALFNLIRSPFTFVAVGLATAKHNGKASRFMQALLDGWRNCAEGSKVVFEKMIDPLKAAISESDVITGRPTLKAAGALLIARLIQLLWLLGIFVLFLSGIAFLFGFYRGARRLFSSGNAGRPGVLE